MAALTAPSKELLDLWKLLWQIDVKKDHKSDHDAALVNSLLPNPKFESGITFYEGQPGVGAPIVLPPLVTFYKDEIMNYVLKPDNGKVFYKEDSSSGIFGDDITYANPAVLQIVTAKPLNKKYQVLTVEIEEGAAKKDYITKIKDFFALKKTPIYINYDTGAYLPEVLKGVDYMSDVYTRANESDAAGKPNTELGNKIYFEEAEPFAVTYPKYTDITSTFPLSQFYCKYTVNLIQEPKDINAKPKGHLNVKMTYINDNNIAVIVDEGCNTAGAARKQKELQKKGYNVQREIDKSNLLKMIYLSKHHGDIGQVLDQHRIIKMKQYATANAPIKTNKTDNAGFCFVSIDQNALTKYFTTGGEYAMFYKMSVPKGAGAARKEVKKIALFRPANISVKEEFDYLQKQVLEYCESTYKNIIKYNAAIPDLNARLAALPALAKALLSAPLQGTDTEKYKELLKRGSRIAMVLQFIPKVTLTDITDTEDLERKLVAARETAIPEEPEEAVFNAQKEIITTAREAFIVKEKDIKFPIGHIDISPYTATGEIESGDVEVDLMFEITGGTLSKKSMERIWQSANVEYDPSARSLRNAFCRVGTKHTTYWCLDLVKITHKLLEEFDPNLAKFYIYSLEQQLTPLPKRLAIWADALNIIGLVPVKKGDIKGNYAIAAGGGGEVNNKKRKNRYNNQNTRKLGNTTNTTRKNKRTEDPTFEKHNNENNNVVSNEPQELNEDPYAQTNTNMNLVQNEPLEVDDTDRLLNVLETELTDMRAVLDFYIQLSTVDPDDIEKIQQLHLDFFRSIYDDLSGIPPSAEEDIFQSSENDPLPAQMEGGARVAVGDPLTELDILEGVKFFMTVPTILHYEASLASVSKVLEKLQTLREDVRKSRIEQLTVLKTQLEEKIKQYYKVDKISEEEIEEGNQANEKAELEAKLIEEEGIHAEEEDPERIKAREKAQTEIRLVGRETFTIKQIVEGILRKRRSFLNISTNYSKQIVSTIQAEGTMTANKNPREDAMRNLVENIKLLGEADEAKKVAARAEVARILGVDQKYLDEFGIEVGDGGAGGAGGAGAGGRGGARKYNNRTSLKKSRNKKRTSKKVKRRSV